VIPSGDSKSPFVIATITRGRRTPACITRVHDIGPLKIGTRPTRSISRIHSGLNNAIELLTSCYISSSSDTANLYFSMSSCVILGASNITGILWVTARHIFAPRSQPMKSNLQIVPRVQHKAPEETAADRIAGILAERGELQAEIDRLRSAQARLQAPIDHEAAVRACYGEIADSEAQDVKEWAQNGQGEPPAPRTADRQALDRRLAQASQAADAARTAAADLGSQIQAKSVLLGAFAPRIEAEILAFIDQQSKQVIADLAEASTMQRRLLADAMAICDIGFNLGHAANNRQEGTGRQAFTWAAEFSDVLRANRPREPADSERGEAVTALRQTILDMTKGIVTP
jgi:hypothetical protein